MKHKIKRHIRIRRLLTPLSSEIYTKRDNKGDFTYIYLFGILIIKWRIQ